VEYQYYIRQFCRRFLLAAVLALGWMPATAFAANCGTLSYTITNAGDGSFQPVTDFQTVAAANTLCMDSSFGEFYVNNDFSGLTLEGQTKDYAITNGTVRLTIHMSAPYDTYTFKPTSTTFSGPASFTLYDPNGNTVTINITVNPPAPTLTSFAYGSTITYNTGSASATSINVATGASATGSPTSYSVSNASGGTFGASSASSGGGTVTINSSGVASYTPKIGYRGTDTFYVKAANGSGESSAVMVSVSVGNPTITATLSGSGATVNSALSGYAVVPSGGKSPYSCTLFTGPLPGGVSLASNCSLTGTPTSSGTFGFVVTVIDSSVTGANGGTSSPFVRPGLALSIVIAPAAPTVTGISPTSGSTSGGTAVIITGTNFSGATSVNFGGTAASGFTVNSATQITATAPANAAGTVDVTVTTAGGTSSTGAADQFTYATPPAAPVVIAPANGASTSSVTPSYAGTAGTNLTIRVYVDGSPVGTTTSNGAGNWTFTQPTALAQGSHTVLATATDGFGQTSSASPTNTFSIVLPPVATSATVAAVSYNAGPTAISVTGYVTNSPTSYAVSSATTANGGSVAINSSGLATYTAPTGFRGNDSFAFTATNAAGTSSPATITVPVGNPTLSISLSGSAVRGTALSGVQIVTSGGRAPYSCAATLASGSLPAGTQLNADCTITGTPTASGTFNFTVNVTDSSLGTGPFTQTSGTLTLSAAPPSVSLSPAGGALPAATEQTAYSQTLTASGATAPYSYAVTAGSLPSGIVLTGGTIAGTPTVSGTFAFTITATDSSSAGSGGPYMGSYSYSLYVSAVAAPVAANRSGVVVAYGSTGTAIDLSTSITGLHSSIAVATAPAHGTVGISGDVVTYTPASGYFGADSFTYTATGVGGTSGAATVSLTVSSPTAPVAANVSSVAVAYGSTGTAIDLSASVTGVHTSIAVATAPAHGTTSVAGDVVTYTPAAGYYGADSFTYTATGPGGTSSAATVSLTVANPAAPVAANVTGVAVAYGSTGTAIDLSGSITGSHSSIAVATAPAHGSVSVAGAVVTYTPTASYYGADSFTYTATGPGGTSGAATVSVTVATPSAPVVADRASVAVPGSSPGMAIDLSTSITGVHSSIAVATPPAHGTASVAGDVVTYTPTAGYYGADSFTYTATGAGGTSATARVALTIQGAAAVAQSHTFSLVDGQTQLVELTAGATGGPFTGAQILSVAPMGSATVELSEGTAGGNRTYTARIVLPSHAGGTSVVTYALRNAYGVSAPATITLQIAARPDPANDPAVKAVSDAQAEGTLRFAQAQTRNFSRRMEALHNGGGAAAQMDVQPSFTDARRWNETAEQANLRLDQALISHFRTPVSASSGAGATRAIPAGPGPQRHGARGDAPAASAAPSEKREVGSLAAWAGGSIEIGTRNPETDSLRLSVTSTGLSSGIDVKLADNLILGIGGGYGWERSDHDKAMVMRGSNRLAVTYGSFTPSPGVFLDAMIGIGDVTYRTTRQIEGITGVARGKRDGSTTIGSIAFGIERGDEVRWSAYGRAEWLDGTLHAYQETGAGVYDLRFDARSLSSVGAVLGGRASWPLDLAGLPIRPHLRAEWRHELARQSAQTLDYADVQGSSAFTLRGTGLARNQIDLAIGSSFALPRAWSVDIEAQVRAAESGAATGLRVELAKHF
jgi:uncharacterized protein YhjY with autotransporter beta-barrel domain